MAFTRRRRQQNKTKYRFRYPRYIVSYFERIFRGGGNFIGSSCEAEPALNYEMIQTPEFQFAFNKPPNDSLNLLLDEIREKKGAFNSVVPAKCSLNSDRVTYAFRRSIDLLPVKNRLTELGKAYDELTILVKLSDLNLAPKVYMAGIYNHRTYQIMEYIVPFYDAVKLIRDSKKTPKDKTTLLDALFNKAYELYSEIGEKTSYVFIDIKPENLGIRGDVLSGDFQVLIIDTDPKYTFDTDDTYCAFNSAVEYAYNNGAHRAPIQNIRRAFMVFLFAAITYIGMVHDNKMIKYLRANHNIVVDTLIGSINLHTDTELKKLIDIVHTYLYKNNKIYKDIINGYIIREKAEAERVGIIFSQDAVPFNKLVPGKTYLIYAEKYVEPIREGRDRPYISKFRGVYVDSAPIDKKSYLYANYNSAHFRKLEFIEPPPNSILPEDGVHLSLNDLEFRMNHDDDEFLEELQKTREAYFVEGYTKFEEDNELASSDSPTGKMTRKLTPKANKIALSPISKKTRT